MIRNELLSGQEMSTTITALPLAERARSQSVREALAKEFYNPQDIAMENKDILGQLSDMPFRKIGQKLVKGETLSFEEAFLGMTFVVGATNRAMFQELKPAFQRAHGLLQLDQTELIGPAQAFLTGMAQKETHGAITAEEIAGMVASAMMDINYRFAFDPYVLETGGMGGDKGFVVNGEKRKVINASTLSAIVLSSIGISVVKHGSYANTSAVGSTEAIEALGVNIYQRSGEEIERMFGETNFYFSDAHAAKTIHDLSHNPFMRHETVNHIIGPMTPPIDRNTRLHKIVGVNEGIHPSLVAKAYEILNERGYQRVGNVIVISGLSRDFTGDNDIYSQKEMRQYMMLDEISPYSTLLGLVRDGKYIGCVIVSPEDFGVHINPDEIQLVNTQEELLAANGKALAGLSSTNSDYLAINAAIGLFVTEYMDRPGAIDGEGLNKQFLQECFVRCSEIIRSGHARSHLEKIVHVSKEGNE